MRESKLLGLTHQSLYRTHSFNISASSFTFQLLPCLSLERFLPTPMPPPNCSSSSSSSCSDGLSYLINVLGIYSGPATDIVHRSHVLWERAVSRDRCSSRRIPSQRLRSQAAAPAHPRAALQYPPQPYVPRGLFHMGERRRFLRPALEKGGGSWSRTQKGQAMHCHRFRD